MPPTQNTDHLRWFQSIQSNRPLTVEEQAHLRGPELPRRRWGSAVRRCTRPLKLSDVSRCDDWAVMSCDRWGHPWISAFISKNALTRQRDIWNRFHLESITMVCVCVLICDTVSSWRWNPKRKLDDSTYVCEYPTCVKQSDAVIHFGCIYLWCFIFYIYILCYISENNWDVIYFWRKIVSWSRSFHFGCIYLWCFILYILYYMLYFWE